MAGQKSAETKRIEKCYRNTLRFEKLWSDYIDALTELKEVMETPLYVRRGRFEVANGHVARTRRGIRTRIEKLRTRLNEKYDMKLSEE